MAVIGSASGIDLPILLAAEWTENQMLGVDALAVRLVAGLARRFVGFLPAHFPGALESVQRVLDCVLADAVADHQLTVEAGHRRTVEDVHDAFGTRHRFFLPRFFARKSGSIRLSSFFPIYSPCRALARQIYWAHAPGVNRYCPDTPSG